tara:strand:- start:399 stop:1436 length:1038 start_codon:yes stop_codon:yes gene_type:complete
MAEITEQIVREAPEIEAIKLGLLQSAKTEADREFTLPEYQRAEMSPDQLNALATGRAGIGDFQGYLNNASNAMNVGQSVVNQGMDAVSNMGQYAEQAGQGLGALAGAAQMYDPNSAQAFMNPYNQQVMQQGIMEMDRQNAIASQGLNAQAARAGAFGGSRGGIQQAEMGRNLADMKNNAIFSSLQQGYGAAQAQSQQAFEQQQQRQLQQAGQYANISNTQASILDQMGQGLGSLGTQMGNMGVQQAALGAQQQQLGQNDTNFLYNLGATQQADLQSQYDTERANDYQKEMKTRQDLAFLSDIYKGAPSSSMAVTTGVSPAPSAVQQIVGLGTGAAATAKAVNGIL